MTTTTTSSTATSGTSVLHRAVVDSPVGPLTIVASERGLRALMWMGDGDSRVRVGASSDGDDPHGVIAATAAQLEEYFAGNRTDFDLPLDPIGTEFQQSAWMALRTIPFGETVSYGEQARRMGDQRKARAVGSANGRNPISIIVPCHRVVGADGSLTGFGGGIENKAWLLDHERSVWSGMIVS
ncbi:MAG: ogt [Acidimicrobiales bacterium]|nr:ogt [Acidimicrobiales bacterium]